jgi:hypothetical protein
MRWSLIIQEKVKAALLLGSIMLVVVASTLISRNNMEGIDRSFSSIYQDRLVPAIDIVYLSENLFTKRLLVEKLLLSEDGLTQQQVEEQLRKHDTRIDSLINAFSHTYLVTQESKSLVDFRGRVKEYAGIEKKVLNLREAGNQKAGKVLFEGAGATSFQGALVLLKELTQIQSDIGKELVRESHVSVARFLNLSILLISLAVVIGLMVLRLIHSAGISRAKEQPFHLN